MKTSVPFDFTTPALLLGRWLRGDKFLTVTWLPPGWTGHRLVAHLRNRGVRCGHYGVMDSDGELTMAVDNYEKAMAALKELYQ